jgi:hypothetical protein
VVKEEDWRQMRCTRWEGGSCTWRGVAAGADVQDGKAAVVLGEGWQWGQMHKMGSRQL